MPRAISRACSSSSAKWSATPEVCTFGRNKDRHVWVAAAAATAAEVATAVTAAVIAAVSCSGQQHGARRASLSHDAASDGCQVDTVECLAVLLHKNPFRPLQSLVEHSSPIPHVKCNFQPCGKCFRGSVMLSSPLMLQCVFVRFYSRCLQIGISSASCTMQGRTASATTYRRPSAPCNSMHVSIVDSDVLCCVHHWVLWMAATLTAVLQ